MEKTNKTYSGIHLIYIGSIVLFLGVLLIFINPFKFAPGFGIMLLVIGMLIFRFKSEYDKLQQCNKESLSNTEIKKILFIVKESQEILLQLTKRSNL